jgi:hypothetical protein
LVGSFPERWFWSDLGLYMGADGKPIPLELPPTELDYFDEQGPVGLIGYRPAGGGTTRFGGMVAASGVGMLTADYTVDKAFRASNYVKINGLRSKIDGLSQWLNLWAHRTSSSHDFAGRIDGSALWAIDPQRSAEFEVFDPRAPAISNSLSPDGRCRR